MGIVQWLCELCISVVGTRMLPARLLGRATSGMGKAWSLGCTLNRTSALPRPPPNGQPFHNYTKRRLYREPAFDGRRKGRRDRRGEDEASESGSEADESEVEGEVAAVAATMSGSSGSSSQSSQVQGSAAADHGSSTEASSSSGSSQPTDGAAAGEQQAEGETLRRHQVQLQWKQERDNADLVTRRHFR